MTEIVAKFDSVSYLYPRSSKLALRDVSLEIKKGEFVGLIGPSGAGKTTLCLTFNGIVPQFYGGRFWGKIVIAGMDSLEVSIHDLARRVGMVFEDPETQITATSVEAEVAFALENLGVPREEIEVRIVEVLKILRLEGMEDKHPHELSGGQKQRLAIASALALQPELLVLDEPTSQLDTLGQQEIFAALHALNQKLGITVVIASHASEALADYADRLILLADGEVIASGRPNELYSQVPLLETCGVRPPQVSQIFHLIASRVGQPAAFPVTLNAGIAHFRDICEHYRLACPKFAALDLKKTGTPLFSVQELCYRYPDGTEALRGVSLDIHRGEYVLVAGHNGAGKSTLVKHFLSLSHPTSGKVLVDGVSTDRLSVSALARRIGYVAQNPDNQIFNATVWEEVAFSLRVLGYSDADVQCRVKDSLATLDLLEQRDLHPLSLPRSDRVRVVVAAALALQPEAIVFDEPTTAQDYRGAKVILELSRTLHALGKTVVVITHQLYLMPSYAERMIVLGGGKIVLDAPLRQAFHALETLRTASLVPPQAVLLSRVLDPEALLVTPDEVAACFFPND